MFRYPGRGSAEAGPEDYHQPLLIDIAPKQATADTIQQICIKVNEDHKQEALATLIHRYNPYLMLVFCASKERAIALSDWLYGEGFNVDVLHGDMSQAKRRTVMENFRKAKLQILVASDIAARGLDVEGITQVVNYDIPTMRTGMCTALDGQAGPVTKAWPLPSTPRTKPVGSKTWSRN